MCPEVRNFLSVTQNDPNYNTRLDFPSQFADTLRVILATVISLLKSDKSLEK